MSENEEDKKTFISALRELYCRMAWSHIAYEKDRDISQRHVVVVRIINVIAVAISTLLAYLGTVYTESCASLYSIIFGIFTTAFLVYQLSFNPSEKESKHSLSARKMLSLRDKCFLLLSEAMEQNSVTSELREKMFALLKEQSLIYELSPHISNRAYELADKDLSKGDIKFNPQDMAKLLPDEFLN